MVKRQRKGFVARLLSLVVVVLILAAAAILRDGRILGHDLREAHEAKALKNDTLEVTPDGAFVVNTKPLAKDVQGYGGPVPLKIHIKDGRVAAVEAEPNAESPDFFNRAKELLSVLETREKVVSLLSHQGEMEISVRIGPETGMEETKDCSIVTASYRLNDGTVNTIGLIGPTRMQ